MRTRRSFCLIICAMFGFFTANAWGDMQQAGDYRIHYAAVSTDFLTPEVARANGIQRSAGLGLVNVSVRQRQSDGTMRAVNADVKGRVGELDKNSQTLTFRTVRDNDAVYQLATFRLQHDAPLHFALKVRADRNAGPERIDFIQRFYIER
ncbi:MAG: DUF4426 domain-containing protein [Halomonas subglaciescola]|nr:DUF4426 domain-containing protein [Halomonas subglaciescola]